MKPLAREASLALVLMLPSAALAQTSTTTIQPFVKPLLVPQQGYVIQSPGRLPVYVNPLPGGNYYINDLNKGPSAPPPIPNLIDGDEPDD